MKNRSHKIPFVKYWYPSYSLVESEFSESCTNWSNFFSSSCSVKFIWNRFRRLRIVPAQPFLKHGNCAPKELQMDICCCLLLSQSFLIRQNRFIVYLLLRIISTIFITRSMCFRAAIKPLSNKCWNSVHSGDSNPPITSTNSGVNLKGDCSKPMRQTKSN